MKILFICDFFEPINIIGGRRPSEFVRRFRDLGDDVDVITLTSKKYDFNKEIINDEKNIFRIDIDTSKYFKIFRLFTRLKKFFLKNSANNTPVSSSNSSKSMCNRVSIVSFVKAYFHLGLDILYGKCAKKAYLHIFKINKKNYDVIYTTYSGFGSLLAGEKIKKRYKIKWIVDMRDAIYYQQFIKAHKSYYKKFLCKHCNFADFA